MAEEPAYEIHRDVKYGYSTLIDVPAIVRECTAEWFNQSLCLVNDCVVRLAVVRGEFHWHKHDEEDEFFFVLSGGIRGLLSPPESTGGECGAIDERDDWRVRAGQTGRTS